MRSCSSLETKLGMSTQGCVRMRLPAALGRSSTHPMALSVSQQKWRGNAVSVKKNLKRMKRWEGWNVAMATMCTASSSGSLRRTLAQFARLLSPRLEIPTPGTFCRTGWNRKKYMLFCTAHYICYCYINTTSIRCILQIEMPYFGSLSSNLWVLNSETPLVGG